MNYKQRKFCREYLKDGKATQAAKRAGYSPKTAYSKGSQLLKIVEVKKYLADFAAKLLEREKEGLEYDLIHQLRAIALADVTDDIKIETFEYQVPIFNKKGKDTGKKETKKAQRVAIKDSDQFKHGRAVSSIQQTKDGIKITYASKEKAIELLGKTIGIFVDKTDITVRNDNPEGNKNAISGFVPFKGADVSEK